MVCPFGIHHRNSPQCLQVEVSIEITIACFWANFSGNLEKVHHTEDTSYVAVLAVFHGYVPALLYRLDYQIIMCSSTMYICSFQYERSFPGPPLSDGFLMSTRSLRCRTAADAFLS